MRARSGVLLLVLVTLMAGCAPAGLGNRSSDAASAPAAQTGPRHLIAAVQGDPKSLGLEAGTYARPIRGLLHAGLANPDEKGEVRAQLAEQVPSIENGLWKVLPDGRMETTWKIRPNARWHDGTPFTSDDVVFTAQAGQDRDMPSLRDPALRSVESVQAVDPVTVLVTFKELYIDADRLFGYPLPRHILESTTQEDKANITEYPFWSREFVGTGPFKLREWAAGSHILVDANDDYVLGRPKIDEIEIKLIPNDNTMIANLLAGSVDLPLGQTLSLEQAIDLRGRWQEGHVEIVPRPGWTVIYPQFTYTNPPIIQNLQFRRALMYAINRQEMIDTLVSGFSVVADSLLPVGHPEFAEIKARVPHYEFDPTRSEQLIVDLGYTKREGQFRDATGQPLSVEMRTSANNDNTVKAVQSVTDYWQRAGIGVDAVFIPSQQQNDREYRSTFPGFILSRHTADETYFVNFTSSRVATRENNWVGGDTGYHNPEYDALYQRYSQTIPMKERIEALGQLDYHVAEQMVAMGLYYDNLVACIGNRVANVVVPQYYGAQWTWSAHLWDLQGAAYPSVGRQ